MGGLGGIGSWLGSPKSPFGAMGGALGGIGGALGNLLNVGPLPPFPNLGLFPWDKKDSSGKPIQPSPFPGLTGAIDLPSKLGALGTIDWGGVGKTFGNFTSGLGNVNFPDLGKSFSGIASGLPQVNFPDLGKTFGSFASIKLPDLSKIQLPDFSKLLSGFQLPDFSKLLSGIQLPDLSKLFGGFEFAHSNTWLIHAHLEFFLQIHDASDFAHFPTSLSCQRNAVQRLLGWRGHGHLTSCWLCGRSHCRSFI